MELTANVTSKLMAAVVGWAAEHNLSVDQVVTEAIVQYLMDVDAGLVLPPKPPLRSALMVPRRMRTA